MSFDLPNMSQFSGGAPLTFPANQDRLPGYATFTEVLAEAPEGGGSGAVITLPLPEGLSHADGIQYENTDLGLVKGAMVSNSSADKAKKDAEGGTPAPASDQEGEQKGVFQKMMEDVAIRVGGDTGRLIVGSAPNPNTRAVFKQVGMRSYQFQYKLMPTSTGEAEEIQNIVKKFREIMYPAPEGYSENFITAFKFPNLFQIEFWIGGGGSETLIEPQLLPAYLQTMNTSYGGPIMAKNGGNFSFSETTISLTFMEYRALNQRDIQKGF